MWVGRMLGRPTPTRPIAMMARLIGERQTPVASFREEWERTWLTRLLSGGRWLRRRGAVARLASHDGIDSPPLTGILAQTRAAEDRPAALAVMTEVVDGQVQSTTPTHTHQRPAMADAHDPAWVVGRADGDGCERL